MQQGSYPAFRQEPGQHRGPNNPSGLQNLEVVGSEVEEWLEQGAVIRLAEPACCTSTLSAATRLDTATGTEADT